jgi:succinate dehydrogenase hydrophobic anchor subunit
MTYLNTQILVGPEEKKLTVGSIGLMAFAMVLFMYGFIGLLSNWLEGSELRPGIHQPEPSSLPMVAGVVLAILLVVLSGFFVRALIFANNPETGFYNDTTLQAGVFASMMLLLALMIAIYKKFFMMEEVLAEDEKGDFPW